MLPGGFWEFKSISLKVARFGEPCLGPKIVPSMARLG